MHGADGAIAYLLIMLEDITARREVEMAAAASLAALERLDGLKSEFVAVVSHEFRTALVGIQGFSEIMRDETLSDAEVREYATDINMDALRLSRMITEMLDLDRIESGRMTLHLSQVDMLDLVTAAVERARASTSNHTISVRCEQRPPRFSGDSDRLSQVLTNILSNAIKYSPKGGDITVSLGSNATGLSIAIQDQGLGIPADFLGRVFDRYERYESSAADRIIGTGLGLPIAHQIVEMHGGSITVASPEGHGTVFTIHLPFAH